MKMTSSVSHFPKLQQGLLDGSSMVRLRVLAASTGECYNISLPPNELSVSNIRSRLAVALPVDDQILLIGPPYKVPKDSLLRTSEIISALRLGDEEDDYFTQHPSNDATSQSYLNDKKKLGIIGHTEKTGSKRLFVFSKRALSDSSPDPPVCILKPSPEPLIMPTIDTLPPPLLFPAEIKATPLRMALEVYERQFMLDMAKGRAYADGAELRLDACKKCIVEQVVIAQALRAAVSNLADHRSGAVRERTQFTAEYNESSSSHSKLLDRFDSRLSWEKSPTEKDRLNIAPGVIMFGSGKSESLGNIALHPSLVSVARSSGRVMESLLDTVPLEQERAWAGKCRTAHERLALSFQELESTFGTALGTSASWNEYVKGDLEVEEKIKVLFAEVEDVGISVRHAQAERLRSLVSYHNEATRIVLSALKNESETAEKMSVGAGANSAFSTLEEMSQASSSIIPSMELDDKVLAEMSKRVADAKTDTMKRMKVRLRQISVAQSAIARANASVTVLRHALSQQKIDIEHLDHVVELPTAYYNFILEIQRRRSYCQAFTSNATYLISRLNSMRADEVSLREKFLRGPGRHLMPAFFEIFAPTLTTPPPIFSPALPDMAELDSLPDIRDESLLGVSSLQSDNTESMQHDDRASSTSTIPDCLSLRHPPSKEKGDMTLPKGFHVLNSVDNPSVIMGNDDSSGNDVMMRTVCHEDKIAQTDEVIADYATLAYENAALRQALECAGIKAPHSYIESEISTQLSTKRVNELEKILQNKKDKIHSLEVELTSMQKQLEKERSASIQVPRSSIAEQASEEPCDKISHTSFQVGDVGLFMPTGRGREGTRIYLAFHSGCPHRYLSPDSIIGTPDFVLGRIVYQEECVAGAVDTDSNPFGLNAGTKFWILTVETLKRG